MISFFFSGCDGKIEKMIWDNIAEVREFALYGVEDNISITLMCGQRESEYKMDGYATSLIPFGVITITLADGEDIEVQSSSFVLFVGTEKFEGDLIKNPFDGTLVADIGKEIDRYQNISIDVYINDEKESLKLKNVDEDWKINVRDCIDILLNNFDREIKGFVNDDTFEGEVYIKIIDDYDKFMSKFYYYVSVVDRRGSSISMLISPLNGEILASNSNILP